MMFCFHFLSVATSIPAGFPVITRGPALDVVEKGYSAVLNCEASGNPDPELLWFKDYIPVDLSTERIKLTSCKFFLLQLQ